MARETKSRMVIETICGRQTFHVLTDFVDGKSEGFDMEVSVHAGGVHLNNRRDGTQFFMPKTALEPLLEAVRRQS